MELIRGLHNLDTRHRGCVLTIGNYDGVHLGHQAVLRRLQEKSAALELPSLVITFEPTPREFFEPEAAPARLSSLREKYIDLAANQIDRMLCVRFNREFAGLAAADFVNQLLLARLDAAYIVVGDDFRFGHRREGDFALLERLAGAEGVEVCSLPPFNLDGGRVSSTRIRQTLAEGNTGLAADMLGRRYRIIGRVVQGRALGRTLGVPTANIVVRRKPAPRFGVYAVQVLVDGVLYRGAGNFGVRPTVDGDDCQLEVHLFDFQGELYGKRLEVRFLDFIRPEQRFDSLEMLKTAMRQDIQDIQASLSRRGG